MEARTRSQKRNTNNSKGKAVLIVFVTILILVFIGISTYIYYILSMDTFYPGIKVDGVALEGMTYDQAKKALESINKPRLEAMNITLVHDGKMWEYDYQAISAAVNIDEVVAEAYAIGRKGNFVERLLDILECSSNGREYSTTLTYDVSQLEDELKVIAGEINTEPVSATVAFHEDRKEKFTFTPHKLGKGMLVERALTELKAKVDAGDLSPYEIPTQVLHPEYTLDEVKTWTSKIAHYSTPLSDNRDRTYNIELSSKSYDGLRLDPGQVFSLNEATGPRDAAHGYRNAPVIKEGKKLEDAPGGGNCQTSTTLYGAVMRADLEIVERHPHSFPSTYTEVGQDATVNYPYADFKFKNNMDTPIFINRYFSGGRLHVEIYGKAPAEYDRIDVVTEIISRTSTPPERVVNDPEMLEEEEKVEYKSRPGIKARTYRVYYKDGKEIKRVLEDVSNYPRIVGLKKVGVKKPAPEEPENGDFDDIQDQLQGNETFNQSEISN